MKNKELVSKGLDILRDVFAPYICRELSLKYGGEIWWRKGILERLYPDQKRNLPQTGDFATLIDSLDIAQCVLLFADIYWNDIFKEKSSDKHRTWANESRDFRNELAHIGGNDFSESDTWRALDTMSRLCERLDLESAGEIRELSKKIQDGATIADRSSANEQSTKRPETGNTPNAITPNVAKNIETVWANIVRNEGEKFYTKDRVEFIFSIDGDSFEPKPVTGTKYKPVAKETIEHVLLNYMPLKYPTQLPEQIYPRSYIYAILVDKRIV